MFPEYLCTVMNIFLNKELRQLVTFAGVDGNSKNYMGF